MLEANNEFVVKKKKRKRKITTSIYTGHGNAAHEALSTLSNTILLNFVVCKAIAILSGNRMPLKCM